MALVEKKKVQMNWLIRMTRFQISTSQSQARKSGAA